MGLKNPDHLGLPSSQRAFVLYLANHVDVILRQSCIFQEGEIGGVETLQCLPGDLQSVASTIIDKRGIRSVIEQALDNFRVPASGCIHQCSFVDLSFVAPVDSCPALEEQRHLPEISTACCDL